MRLLLADDHTLFRDALVQYIERADPGSEVVTTKTFDEAYDVVEADQKFDLILLDLKMPGMKGLKGLEKIRQTHPDIRVALMSGLAEANDVKEAMDMGAAGYFPKTLSGQAMMKAIELVMTGERFVPIDHRTHMVTPSYISDDPPKSLKLTPNLTPREKDVLEHLARGESNKEIARALDLQIVTIKLHVRGICKKLDVANRTQAALKAQEMGLTSQTSIKK